ncbi:MAG: metal ABC transporter permease, partial [Deltaproteobacteria bacterium]|nr:metal ABC transporter permease [Deltaproteobacteria bacterium]
MLELMLKPFIECLILVGIHAYLGLHVIRRRVIFVDLALAQIAALGTIVGGILGLMDGTPQSLLYSLTFCLVGAALFTFTRVRHDRIPHEAVIGLVYIIAFSMAVLIVQKTEGVEHMEGILVGNLLYVRWSDIIATVICYVLIGGFHLLYWKKFLLISEFPEKAFRQGINVRFWDFLFYASFGFVITFSTRVAGVLLVFVFLVAPAIMALLVSKRFSHQLTVGWVSGTIVTVLGLFFSVELDLSPGPTVVAFYGLILAALAVGAYIFRAPDKSKALRYTSIGCGVVAIIACGVYFEGRLLAGFSDEHQHAHQLTTAQEPVATEEPPPDTAKLETATRGCVGPGKIERYVTLPDSLARLEFIQSKFDKGEKKALGFVLMLLSDPDASEFYR